MGSMWYILLPCDSYMVTLGNMLLQNVGNHLTYSTVQPNHN